MKLQKLNTVNIQENEATKLGATCICTCVCFGSKQVALAVSGYGVGAVDMAAEGLWDYITKAIGK